MELKDFTNIDYRFNESGLVWVIEVIVPSTGHFPWVTKLISADANLGPVDMQNLEDAKKFEDKRDAQDYLDNLID